jgi:hypothetical protein
LYVPSKARLSLPKRHETGRARQVVIGCVIDSDSHDREPSGTLGGGFVYVRRVHG